MLTARAQTCTSRSAITAATPSRSASVVICPGVPQQSKVRGFAPPTPPPSRSLLVDRRSHTTTALSCGVVCVCAETLVESHQNCK